MCFLTGIDWFRVCFLTGIDWLRVCFLTGIDRLRVDPEEDLPEYLRVNTRERGHDWYVQCDRLLILIANFVKKKYSALVE